MIAYYDSNIPGLESIEGDITLLPFDPSDLSSPDSHPTRLDLVQADALFIRTVTKITPAHFPELDSSANKVRFIATASAGKDHVDESWLNALGIKFAHAPGCNARAVAEYVATSLLIWLDSQSGQTRQKDHVSKRPVIGLVGAGSTGSATATLLRSLGFEVLLYDPPKERVDPNFKSCSLQELRKAEVWSLHVPLTTEGKDATHHLVNHEWVSEYNVRLIIQASRGGVLDESILWDREKPAFICDVWEGEPALSPKTLQRAVIATPHIAGYSIEAKHRAVKQILEAFNSHFQQHLRLPEAESGHSEPPSSSPFFTDPAPPSSLSEAVATFHPVLEYDAQLRKALESSEGNFAQAFTQIRNHFPLRHELSATSCPENWLKKYPELSLLGVNGAKR